MRYPVAISIKHGGNSYGVVAPDFYACFAVGKTVDEAITNARVAIEAQLSMLLKQGHPIPEPSDIEQRLGDPDYIGWLWESVEVNLEPFQKTT